MKIKCVIVILLFHIGYSHGVEPVKVEYPFPKVFPWNKGVTHKHDISAEKIEKCLSALHENRIIGADYYFLTYFHEEIAKFLSCEPRYLVNDKEDIMNVLHDVEHHSENTEKSVRFRDLAIAIQKWITSMTALHNYPVAYEYFLLQCGLHRLER